MNQELDIHRQHAAERLRADTMEQRWQAKTKECNALREIIAKLNEELFDTLKELTSTQRKLIDVNADIACRIFQGETS